MAIVLSPVPFVQMTVDDLALVLGTNVAGAVAGLSTSQTNAAVPGGATQFSNINSPFRGLALTYTTGASLASGQSITLGIASTSRTPDNVHRLVRRIHARQRALSNKSLANGARLDFTV